jgi:hypothetical protein
MIPPHPMVGLRTDDVRAMRVWLKDMGKERHTPLDFEGRCNFFTTAAQHTNRVRPLTPHNRDPDPSPNAHAYHKWDIHPGVAPFCP